MQSLHKIKLESITSDIKKLATTRRYIPNIDSFNSNFKHLMYLRYTDDFVILAISLINDVCDIRKQRQIRLKCGIIYYEDKRRKMK